MSTSSSLPLTWPDIDRQGTLPDHCHSSAEEPALPSYGSCLDGLQITGGGWTSGLRGGGSDSVECSGRLEFGGPGEFLPYDPWR